MSREQQSPEAIFNAARAIADPLGRNAYLQDACGSDLGLRARIDALLKADADAGSFLAGGKGEQIAGSGDIRLAVDADATVAHQRSGPQRRLTETPGMQIGPYRLLERIGEGGFGEVWVADQREPVRRKVALKIIKAGMDSREVLARFEAERQALALMDHPGVAKVFDAGATDSGRPYFVMEHVAGLPINEYCDAARLKIHDRLSLFMDVCQVVQHAHQKGIIHRDLKPSNILVTVRDGKPVPKVIDFGIAKATIGRLTDRTLHTEMGKLIGTPEYMAPEQTGTSGLDVDTRADIYSLGVILYELLTGTLPFDPKTLRNAGFDAMAKIIRELEPPKPSTRLSTLAEEAVNRRNGKTPEDIARGHDTDFRTLRREVRGDLDWITLKALEKDRTRRYATPSAFADDVARHLNHEPVLAGPPSAAYRVRKFVRRNRGSVAAVAAVILALTGGLVGTGLMYARAVKERDHALEAERLTQESLEETQQARDEAQAVTKFLTDTLAAADPARQGKDVTVREVLDRAADQIAEKFADKPLLEAQVREAIGSTYHQLGLNDRAEDHFAHAAAIYRTALGENNRRTLRALHNLAVMVADHSGYAAGEAQHRAILAVQRRVLGEEHPDTLPSMNNLANMLYSQGRYAEAGELHRKTLDIQRRVLGEEDPGTLRSMNNLAAALHSQGKYAEAEELYRSTLQVRRRVLGEEHPATLLSIHNVANALSSQGRYAEAEDLHRVTLGVQRRVLGEEHPETLTSMNNLAAVLDFQGRYEEAGELHCKTLDIRRRVLGEEHPDTLRSMNNVALVLYSQGRYAEAGELHRNTLHIQRRVLGAEHPHTLRSMHNVANVLDAEGRYGEAEELYRNTLHIQRRVLGEEHPETLASMNNLAVVLGDQGRYSEAEELHRKTLEVRCRVLGEEHPDTLKSMKNLADVLDEKGHYSEAEELAGKVLTIGEKRGELTGPVRWLTTSVRGGALAGLGRFAEAQPLLVGLYDLIKDRADVTPAEKRRTLDRVIRLYDSWDAAEPEKGYAEKVEEFRTLLEAKHEDAAGK